MKLKLEQLAKVCGGDDKRHVKILMKPVPGADGLFIGQYGNRWFVATRDGHSKAFHGEHEARIFIFFLHMTSQLYEQGIDVLDSLGHLKDILGK